jgi:hypothetical protein
MPRRDVHNSSAGTLTGRLLPRFSAIPLVAVLLLVQRNIVEGTARKG